MLWGLDPQRTATLVRQLADKSLLRVEDTTVSMHDLQMDFLVGRAAANLPALHDGLLAAYAEQCDGDWAAGPDDGYFRQHLARHLLSAGRLAELQALLLDLDWMNTKLTRGDMPGLLADHDTLPSDPAVRLVAGALRMSAGVLADDPGQLPSQLTGRLAGQPDPQLCDLLQRTRRWPGTSWLRPLTASLIPPGGPLLLTLMGHRGTVPTVAISADGQRGVSGGDDGTVRVWDLATGEELPALTGHRVGRDRGVTAVAVSPDGQRAVSGGTDGTVRVWDLATGQAVHTLTGHHGWLRAVAISADGQRAVSGGTDGTVRVWDLATGQAVHTLTGHREIRHKRPRRGWRLMVTAVAISTDGQRAVSADIESAGTTFIKHSTGAERVWDLATGAELHTSTGHGRVTALAVSPDGQRAVSYGEQTVRVWDLATGAELRTLTSQGPVAVSADGQRAVSGDDDGTVRVWNLATGQALHTFGSTDMWNQLTYRDTVFFGVVDGPRPVAVSADGQRAVSGSTDGTVRVWDLTAGQELHSCGHRRWVTAVAISADGQRAVSGGEQTVRVWDLATGEELHTLTAGRVTAIAVSADGQRAVSGRENGTVQMWDLATGEELHTLTGHHGKVGQVAVSADGQRAVSGSDDGTVRIWDLTSGQAVHTLTGHHGFVTAVAISADGQRAVSGDGRRVQVWDLTTGKLVASGRHFYATLFGTGPHVSISADGQRVVYVGGRRVRVLDLATGKEVRTLTGHHGWVTAVAISADGQRAVSGSDDGTVRAWDLTSGQAVHTLTGHHGWVKAVAISADGRLAVSGGDDGTVRVWDLATGFERARFASGSTITCLAGTPPGTRVIAGTSNGAVHLLELCGCG